MDGSAMERLVVELAAESRERFYGKYRGTVSDVDDSDSLGRIKARVPEILGSVESPWALPCVPSAGPNQGWYAIPPVGAGVWIEFEAGDPSRPVWTGAWWGRDELPKDEKSGDTQPTLKILRSKQGLMLALDDDGKTATLSDEDGTNLVTIKVDDGEVRIKAGTKVVVDASQIELVDQASHALVFGDDLLNYLNQLVNIFAAHTHPGEVAGPYPVAPMVPATQFPSATQSLLSTKVKTG
jgi:uncharacterized protein involved in type VI secretion and phage assembly